MSQFYFNYQQEHRRKQTLGVVNLSLDNSNLRPDRYLTQNTTTNNNVYTMDQSLKLPTLHHHQRISSYNKSKYIDLIEPQSNTTKNALSVDGFEWFMSAKIKQKKHSCYRGAQTNLKLQLQYSQQDIKHDIEPKKLKFKGQQKMEKSPSKNLEKMIDNLLTTKNHTTTQTLPRLSKRLRRPIILVVCYVRWLNETKRANIIKCKQITQDHNTQLQQESLHLTPQYTQLFYKQMQVLLMSETECINDVILEKSQQKILKMIEQTSKSYQYKQKQIKIYMNVLTSIFLQFVYKLEPIEVIQIQIEKGINQTTIQQNLLERMLPEPQLAPRYHRQQIASILYQSQARVTKEVSQDVNDN